MSDSRDDDYPEGLEQADELIEKAAALIRKHHGGGASDPYEDLPVLTDVVDEPEPPAGNGARARLAEHLVELDAALGEAIEDWIKDDLPQILSRELDSLVERVREEALLHARATLLARLSRDVAAVLDSDPPAEDDSE